MSTGFPVHDPDTAPEKSRDLLRQLVAQIGPNGFYAVAATSPETLGAYVALHQAFSATSLSAEEKTVVWQTINVENECTFCVPAHVHGQGHAGQRRGDGCAAQ